MDKKEMEDRIKKEGLLDLNNPSEIEIREAFEVLDRKSEPKRIILNKNQRGKKRFK